MIRVIAVGKKHESWITEGIDRYQKRLRKPFDVEWVLLPHSAKTGQEARQNESETILSRLDDNEYVVLLDEKGDLFDSPGLSKKIMAPLERSQTVTVIIGGAYGVDSTVHERADIVWSLSPLVFPHQLVRLILAEQIYRAQGIANSHPYHHD